MAHYVPAAAVMVETMAAAAAVAMAARQKGHRGSRCGVVPVPAIAPAPVLQLCANAVGRIEAND